MPRHFIRQASFAACAVLCAAIAIDCSLLVDVDGLGGGAGTPDGSTSDVTDASNSIDVVTDADAGSTTKDATSCPSVTGRVQSNHVIYDGGTDDSLSISLSDPSFAGDFVVVGTNYDNSCVGVSSVNDTAGNTYVQIVGLDSNAGAGVLETWGAQNIAASDSNTITVTFIAACTGRNVKAVEYTGIATASAVDGFVTQHGDGGIAPNAVIATTAPDVVFAHTADRTTTLGAADGWTQIFIDDWSTLAEEQVFLSPTTVTASSKPAADDDWVIQAVALKICQPN